jgi:hypothetical protein
LTGRGGEPLNTMTADTITAERIESLRAALEAATDSIDLLAGNVKYGNVSTEDAAAIVNETIQNLTIEAR